MKWVKFVFLLAVVASLSACGNSYEVPPGCVAKKITSTGMTEDIIPPGKIWISSMCINCDKLVIAQVPDIEFKESMQIYMPKDRLNLKVDLRGVVKVKKDKKWLNYIFQNIVPKQGRDGVSYILDKQIKAKYVDQYVRSIARGLIQQYSIDEFIAHKDAIAKKLTATMNRMLENTPIQVVYLGFADTQPPAVIIQAQEEAKKREIELAKVEAEKQIQIKRAEAALEVAKKQQEVDLKEAETQVLVNKKLAEGVNQAFVTQRWLSIMNEAVKHPQGKFFILPYEAIKDPTLLYGAVREAQK